MEDKIKFRTKQIGLEILEEAGLVNLAKIEKLKKETNEITAIIVTSQKTVLNRIRLKNKN